MTEFQNDNPYAPPVPVEEDASGYDLRKIAVCYNRLGFLMIWFVYCFIFYFVLMFIMMLTLGATEGNFGTPFLAGMLCVFIIFHLVLGFMCVYSAYLMGKMTHAMKYRFLTISLIVCFAFIFLINVFAIDIMRRKAETILATTGIEIINGRVDLTQITVEEDY